MPSQLRPRLLVKTQPGRVLPAEKGFRFERVDFTVEPLFTTSGREHAFGVAGGERWYVVQPREDLAREENPWDYAHRMHSKHLGLAAADRPTVIEPDLRQSWVYENKTPLMGIGAEFAAKDVCTFNDQDDHGGSTPKGPSFGWFLGERFSQLRSAREMVGSGKRKVRIAHLDTGYDPDHVTRPAGLLTKLQRNFTGDDRPVDDATDPARRGVLKNPGHGTGTLSILAGAVLKGVKEAGPLKDLPLGGAPEAGVVPVRVANSVVHFYTSAVARAFEYAAMIGCDVISMSMGGLASSAWTEAVNRCYEAGVVMVCAAGNNFFRVPTRFIVYPARYNRVIAACGVMADGSPYNGLPLTVMQGNWGPAKKMATALSAYTPNMPWAELGCQKIVDMDGQGTSSATPQIAAAAALWIMHHAPQYPRGWMKVEAVRKALFESALDTGDREHLGRGILRAKDALKLAPAEAKRLSKTPVDSARFGFLRLLTGLGIASTPRDDMYEMEANQLIQTSATLSRILEDNNVDPENPPEKATQRVRQMVVEAMAAEPNCSQALRDHLQRHFMAEIRPGVVAPALPVELAVPPAVPEPKNRELRVYAFDPSLGLELETAELNKTTINVPWEELQPGPVGEYLEVVDIDPASGCAYFPVNLNDPRILAQRGLEPSEGNPQYHQQMVYAVAMKTIQHFERALGRVALWAPRLVRTKEGYNEYFIRRLRLYPHALREANAYYSPERRAILFGYFPASRLHPGNNLPGGMVFTALAHDIIAHETSHALLDGLHRRFAEPTNPDVLAFHEAFADIVALFQHFTLPEALRHQIAKTRGDLARQSILGQLAQQFGQAIGGYGALRDALGGIDEETKTWQPREPNPNDYLTEMEPHARGAILVSAVFEAFVEIYKRRVRDLMQVAAPAAPSGGGLHPNLVNLLSEEAAKTSGHVLNICIRALDYCPPVDITFGEYLRALITADFDLVPEDPIGYRVAFIEAFRRRGIYPEGVRTLSVESLRWRKPTRLDKAFQLSNCLKDLDLSWDLNAERQKAWRRSKRNRYLFHRWMMETVRPKHPDAFAELGLDPTEHAPPTEVHSARPARRLAPDGSFVTEVVVEITQTHRTPVDPSDPSLGEFKFRGGCTLLVDPKSETIGYCISKNVRNEARRERQTEFVTSPGETSLHATYFGSDANRRESPFALLHRGY